MDYGDQILQTEDDGIKRLNLGRGLDCRREKNRVSYTQYSPKTNMEPENHPFKKEHIIFQTSIFGFYVGFRECIDIFLFRFT